MLFVLQVQLAHYNSHRGLSRYRYAHPRITRVAYTETVVRYTLCVRMCVCVCARVAAFQRQFKIEVKNSCIMALVQSVRVWCVCVQ